jgi:type IV secretion system protein VirD4
MDSNGLATIFWLVVIAVFLAGCTEKSRAWKKAWKFNPDPELGDAKFATVKTLRKKGWFRTGGLRLGFDPEGKRPLNDHGAGHILLTAGARRGKLYTILATLILSLPRNYSLILFDPKAELACICAHHRRRFGKVHIVNPFDMFPDRLRALLPWSCINPLDLLDPRVATYHADCDKLATSFWSLDTGVSESHWARSAGILISGVIAGVKLLCKPEDQNLPYVRAVLTGGTGESLSAFCRRCCNSSDIFLRSKLARFAAPGADENKELTSIVSAADTGTAFLGNEAIASCLRASTFHFADLKRFAGTTIIICLPLEMLDVTDKFFRLVAATMLFEVLREGRRKGAPVLAIFDEIAQLGPMKVLTDCWGMAAGAAGLKIMAVYQSASQMMAQFPRDWQNIIQNSSVSLWFGATDPVTRQTVCDLAGVRTVLSQSKSVSAREDGYPNVNFSAGQTVRPLILPHEVGELADDEMIMLCNAGVVRAKRFPYLKEFKGKYRDNPYYTKSGFWKQVFGR